MCANPLRMLINPRAVRLGLVATAVLVAGGARATLPLLPFGDNSENIVFQEDFANAYLMGWSNIAAGTLKATIGPDPAMTTLNAWYPSVNDGSTVTSEVTLPAAMNLANGPIAVYMRVRVDGGNAAPEANRFSVTLTEIATNRNGSLTIRPGANANIGYRNSAGTGLPVTPNGLVYSFPTPTYQDFRLVFTNTSPGGTSMGDYLKLEAFCYNTTTATYVSLGSVSGANLVSGKFNKLGLMSRNGSAPSRRGYFDSVIVTQAGGMRATVPGNAYRLPLPAGMTIQAALDTYKSVVLSKGDYSAGAAFILRSGQQLYGDPAGTTIPPVTVEAGATKAVLSTVKVGAPYTMTFPAATTQVTRGCVFMHLSAAFNVNGGMLLDNLFLDLVGTIAINTSSGGYVRNNRFIRTKTHASSNQLVMLGDSQRNSYGNVFLWRNFLTPGGDATNINHQGDLTFVGVDAESWNFNNTGSGAALWKVGPMGTLRIFGMNGGNNIAYKTGNFDVNADEFQLSNDSMATSPAPLVDYNLGANNLRSLLVNSSGSGKVWTNAATSPFRLKAFDGGTTEVSTSSSSITTPVWAARPGLLPTSPATPDEQSILRGMVVNPSRVAGQVPWEVAHHDPIPDPAGPNWAAERASQPDSTSYLQGLITSAVTIPGGIYYTSSPLKIKRNQAIIGSGADVTVIIAMTPTFDMIIADDADASLSNSRSITVADIALQGGRNGIHFEPVGTGTTQPDGITPIWTGKYDNSTPPKQYVARAQYTACYISHVTLRNMQGSAPGTDGAGIFMDRIYALDNIVFESVHFVNCDTGLKQKTDPGYAGGDVADDPLAARMMYMDKCAFYQCQFVGNRLALDLPGGRACNLNAWIDCLFQNNSGGAAVMNAYLTTVFANCDFINNGGTAVLSSNYVVNHVSNRFVAGSSGVALFGGQVSAEGCCFDRTGSTTARILNASSSRAFLNNCSTTNMPLGLPATASAMLINTTLGADSALNQQLISIKAGVVATLLPGTPVPAAQLLVGSNWAAQPAPPDPSNLTITTGPIRISWQDNSSDETGFRVERKVNAGGTWSTLATVPANTTTCSDSGPFASPNDYAYRVLATGAAGDSGASNTVAFQVSTGYQAWLLANGLPMDASGSGSAAASPANDGLPNLIKYALGLTPAVSGNDGRLSYGKLTASGGDYLCLSYIRPDPAPTGIAYAVESSPDLTTWSNAGLVEVSSTVSAGLRAITTRVNVPITEGPQRFMRMQVTQP